MILVGGQGRPPPHRTCRNRRRKRRERGARSDLLRGRRRAAPLFDVERNSAAFQPPTERHDRASSAFNAVANESRDSPIKNGDGRDTPLGGPRPFDARTPRLVRRIVWWPVQNEPNRLPTHAAFLRNEPNLRAFPRAKKRAERTQFFPEIYPTKGVAANTESVVGVLPRRQFPLYETNLISRRHDGAMREFDRRASPVLPRGRNGCEWSEASEVGRDSGCRPRPCTI